MQKIYIIQWDSNFKNIWALIMVQTPNCSSFKWKW